MIYSATKINSVTKIYSVTKKSWTDLFAQRIQPFMKATACASYFAVTAIFFIQLKFNLCEKICSGNQTENLFDVLNALLHGSYLANEIDFSIYVRKTSKWQIKCFKYITCIWNDYVFILYSCSTLQLQWLSYQRDQLRISQSANTWTKEFLFKLWWGNK